MKRLSILAAALSLALVAAAPALTERDDRLYAVAEQTAMHLRPDPDN